MTSVSDHQYLSIGEVLGLLLEDFPDVTISKIRFLESQGLIEPERTPSGYRKFYDQDVELLRAILHEQKANFLPLKVIRDRIESGAIESDSTGGRTPPRGIRNVEQPDARELREVRAPESDVRDSVFRRTDGGPEWADGNPAVTAATSQNNGGTSGSAHVSVAPITEAVPVMAPQRPVAAPRPAASQQPTASQQQVATRRLVSPPISTPVSASSASSTATQIPPSPLSPATSATTFPATSPAAAGKASSKSARTSTPSPLTVIDQIAPTAPPISTSGARLREQRRPEPPDSEPGLDASSPESGHFAPVAGRLPSRNSAPPIPEPLSTAPEPIVGDASVREMPYSLSDLCEAAGITRSQLAELQEYGILSSRGSGADLTFRPDAVEIARLCGRLLVHGIDARHLRAWRQSAERESALFEQRIMPLLRQRNPQARQSALTTLTELSVLGSGLHNALVESMLQHHFEGT